MDNGSSHGYQKNNGGSNQNLNIPSSTTQSSVGTEASKKSTGVKIIGKVPEANKLKVHSAKADNSTKMSKSGANKKQYDPYGPQGSEIGDDGEYSQNSHLIDSISKMDSSMHFPGSEYNDNDHSEHGGHKPRSVMTRSHVGGDHKHDRMDEGMSMSSKNKYDSKNDGGYTSHMDHGDKHRPLKDGYNKQGEDDDYRNRGPHHQHPHQQHGGPVLHGEGSHMLGGEQGYKHSDMSRGGDRDRNGGYQQNPQGYAGYQQPTKPPGTKNKLKANDEAIFHDPKMQRNMYMQPGIAMQDQYTPHPYNYMQPMPMHPPSGKYPKGGLGYSMGPMHERQEGFDPNMPNPETINGLFNMKPGDQRLQNMPIPFTTGPMGPKSGHGEHGSHHKYPPEDMSSGGKYGKYPGPGMYDGAPGPFDMPPGMVPPGIPGVHPIGRVDKNPPHPNPYMGGPPSTKEGTSTSSRDGNLQKRILELEQQIKEREAVTIRIEADQEHVGQDRS